jgi:urease accessory protein
LPVAQIGIALSVVVLGLAVALQLNLPTFAAAAVCGIFAVFHGYAHGAEMPASMSGVSYGLGFICATLLLHATGVGLGVATGRTGQGRRIVRIGGAAISAAGVALLLSP